MGSTGSTAKARRIWARLAQIGYQRRCSQEGAPSHLQGAAGAGPTETRLVQVEARKTQIGARLAPN